MEDKKAFYVETADGRKFKMVIRGHLGELSVAKIRRYLKSYNVPDGQILTYRGMELSDDMVGEQFGLVPEAVLQLQDPAAPAPEPVRPMRQRPLDGPMQAWGEDPSAEDENRRLAAEVAALRAEVQNLKRENENLQRASQQRRLSAAAGSSHGDPLTNVNENLKNLSDSLGVPMHLDTNLTTVIGTDEDFSILLTYDPSTLRLYVYSTLLTTLPTDPAVRTKLYEILLEGSLLGREVCGGGIGISLQNDIVVLSTSLLMTNCDAQALTQTIPTFVETLKRWRSLVDELVE